MVNRRRCRRVPETWLVALIICCSLFTSGGMQASAIQEGESTESPSADDYIVKLSVLPEYSEGKYGTGHTTQILEVPLKGQWSATDRLDLSLTIPYLWMRGRGDTTIVNGTPLPIVSRHPGQVTTEDGLGDILAEVSYTLLEDKGLVPDIIPFLEVKFPTADASRGLGTGEFDEKIGVYVSKRVGEQWTTHVDLSYTFIGSPAHTELRNVFEWSVGLSYDVTPSLKLSGYIDGATAVSRNQEDPLALRFVGEYKLTKNVQLTVGGSAGLSPGSADFTALAGIELHF
jgi:Putative MetA-pathway of phenol degradation